MTRCAGREGRERVLDPGFAVRSDHHQCANLRRSLSGGETYA
jgi:hypothetical protein